MSRTYLETRFPIADINRMVGPERNSFKPVYTMNKWFARRSSALFRALLLASVLPPEGSLMHDYFYRNHHDNPLVKNKIVLDPFMGGGTTVVEALRLGFRVVGVDLNPVAWFVTKSEVANLDETDLRTLEAEFETLKEEVAPAIRARYVTTCPSCHQEAEAIYVLWVKEAICTNLACQEPIPLFTDWIVAERTFSIPVAEMVCSTCHRRHHAELVQATIVPGNVSQSGTDLNGIHWSFRPNPNNGSECPYCHGKLTKMVSLGNKKVTVSALLCPACHELFHHRGPIPDQVKCPTCSKLFNPRRGNQFRGVFVCPSCGQKDKVIESIRQYNRPLKSLMYAVHGWCPSCAEKNSPATRAYQHKFWTRPRAIDLKVFAEAQHELATRASELLYPRSEIPNGYNTRQMINHLYRYWSDMFNERQLLCLSELLAGIAKRPEPFRSMFLNAFMSTLNANSVFSIYLRAADKIERVFARHDFSPKLSYAENNVWGSAFGRGSFQNCVGNVLKGKRYNLHPWDRDVRSEKLKKIYTKDGRQADFADSISSFFQGKGNCILLSRSSEHLPEIPDCSVDLVVTDPPYGSNVNYSELSDYFYVWLREVLKETNPAFAPPETPKIEEIVVNTARGKSARDYQNGLSAVFRECHRVLKDDGLMVFTFHHSDPAAWVALIQSLVDSGFVVTTTFPVKSEAENSLHLMDKQAISHDIIVVCRKRKKPLSKISWPQFRDQIRFLAANYLKTLQSEADFNSLTVEDTQEVLRGKCLEVYSQYGWVVDEFDQPISLECVLDRISVIVSSIVNSEDHEARWITETDPITRAYFTVLVGIKEISVDQLNKRLRGSAVTVRDLINAFLVKPGKNRRTLVPLDPMDRSEWLAVRENTLLVDQVHSLLIRARLGKKVEVPPKANKEALAFALERLANALPEWTQDARTVLQLLDPHS